MTLRSKEAHGRRRDSRRSSALAGLARDLRGTSGSQESQVRDSEALVGSRQERQVRDSRVESPVLDLGVERPVLGSKAEGQVASEAMQSGNLVTPLQSIIRAPVHASVGSDARARAG